MQKKFIYSKPQLGTLQDALDLFYEVNSYEKPPKTETHDKDLEELQMHLTSEMVDDFITDMTTCVAYERNYIRHSIDIKQIRPLLIYINIHKSNENILMNIAGRLGQDIIQS